MDSTEIAALKRTLEEGAVDERIIINRLGAKQGVLVAQADAIIGLLGYSIILTLQQRSLGQIGLILVQEGKHRRSVGRSLLDADLGLLRHRLRMEIRAVK